MVLPWISGCVSLTGAQPWLLEELEGSSGCWKLCAQSVVGFFTLKEMDDKLHSVYLGFLELSGAVQSPGNSLFQLFIFFVVHLSGRTEGSQDSSSDNWGFPLLPVNVRIEKNHKN